MATPESLAHPPAPGTRGEGPGLLPRHSPAERLTHWAVAICYVLLFLSGLALFHPFFFWTSALFGGGALMRVLHPLVGVALAAFFYPYAARLWNDNRMTPTDWTWVRHMFAYMNKHDGAVPPVDGKYNAGQKLMYWSMLVVIAALALSGVVIWQPWFAPAFPRALRRWAAVVHAVSAFVMFVGIGVHVYAAYWTKGSIRSMTRGTVSRAWARLHYPGWYRQLMGKGDA